jgi:hypothetical protein
MADRKQRAAAIAVSLALLTTGEHAVAQSASELETRLEVGATSSSQPGRIPLSAFALTPGIRYADKRFTFSARGSAWVSGERVELGNSSAALEAYTPLLYGVRAEVLANASRLFFDPTLQNDQLDAEGRLHLMRQRGGVWLGSGVARPLRVTAVQNVNVSSGGIWTKLGSTTLRGSLTSFFFTKLWSPDTSERSFPCTSTQMEAAPPITPAGGGLAAMQATTGGCRHQSRVTDLEGSVRWEHRLLELSVRGGQRFGNSFDVTPESRQWASGQAAFWISGQVAAVAGGGREPAQPTRGLPARSFGSLGLMLAYWPIPRGIVPVESPASLVQAFELRPAGTAVQRVSARIGGVETVEIMGDFSDWAPLQLIRRGRDQWELLVPMTPGVHQINLRIDGGQWVAPPGIPSMTAGFSGEVGVRVNMP